MTTELTIQAADNGMLISDEEGEWVQVVEDTHIIGGAGHENSVNVLGKLFRETIIEAMNRELANNIKVKIEITKLG